MTRSQRSSISIPPSSEGRDNKDLKLLELHGVCASSDEDQLEEMLKSGKYDGIINYKDPDWGDRTALHWCCIKGRGEMARKLLEKGAHPGLRTDVGWTPAHFAAEIGKTHILRLLHNANAPMNRQDLFGDTPREVSKVYNHQDAQEFLKIAEMEYIEKRRKAELSREAGPYDDEDVDWCIRNNILSKSEVFATSSVTGSGSVKDLSLSDFRGSGRRRTSASSSDRKLRNKSVSGAPQASKNKRLSKTALTESLRKIVEKT